ncbi:MAG: DUF5131 family protein [Bryobacterales bacterium]|nr:DUF5131 family protein [Bryobacterales bacterium]
MIAGGELGPAARPMDGFWLVSRNTDQCSAAAVPFVLRPWDGAEEPDG